VCEEEDGAELFPVRGQPAEAPWRLALVTLMHNAQGLTDRRAADAVRTRIDEHEVLSLELTETGCDFSVLSAFRSRLLAEASGAPPVRPAAGSLPRVWVDQGAGHPTD
jgi:transposase